jgi:peptidoglycan/LPS O-acetylase OafA/YrhL
MESPRNNFTENNFDLVRLFAATQVMFGHAAFYVMNCHAQYIPVWIGGHVFHPLAFFTDFPGVPIFFVVSGFLISASYERSQNLKTYFTNRVLRIYPALWFCFALSLAILFAFQVSFTAREFAPWVVAQLTFAQFYNPDFLRNFGTGIIEPGKGVLNGSLWTIPIELQFYVVLPLLCIGVKKIFRRTTGRLFPILFFLFFFALSIFHAGYLSALLPAELERPVMRYSSGTFLPWIYLFLFGWVLQKNFGSIGRFFRGKALFWLAGYFLFLVVARDYFRWDLKFPGFSHLQKLALGCVAISCAYTLPSLASRITRGNDISYGVYIYHVLFVTVFVQLGFYGVLRWDYFLALLVGTYALAAFSWRFLEKPILALKKTSMHKVNFHNSHNSQHPDETNSTKSR